MQDACEQLGVHATYFVNHAVLKNDSAAEVIKQLAKRPGVEIGLHIHPWNTPPLSSGSSEPVRNSFLHNLPQELAIAKLQSVFEIFTQRDLKQPVFEAADIQRVTGSNGSLQETEWKLTHRSFPLRRGRMTERLISGIATSHPSDVNMTMEKRCGKSRFPWDIPVNHGPFGRRFLLRPSQNISGRCGLLELRNDY